MVKDKEYPGVELGVVQSFWAATGPTKRAISRQVNWRGTYVPFTGETISIKAFNAVGLLAAASEPGGIPLDAWSARTSMLHYQRHFGVKIGLTPRFRFWCFPEGRNRLIKRNLYGPGELYTRIMRGHRQAVDFADVRCSAWVDARQNRLSELMGDLYQLLEEELQDTVRMQYEPLAIRAGS